MTDEPNFESLLNMKFRWPTKGDRLFMQSPDWQQNAYIDQHGHGRTVLMMSGYKTIADMAVLKANEDRGDRDFLVYPIIFNYRQFIELSLKYLIATYGRTVGVKAVWNSHDLQKLWGEFKRVLEGYGDQDEEEVLSIVEEIIDEFAKVDPGSFSFRYPVDTKGQFVILAHEELDLANLADVMKGLEGYFTGCDGWLDHLKSAAP